LPQPEGLKGLCTAACSGFRSLEACRDELDGVTVLGITRGAVLEASECLLVGGVDAAQTQSGCIRFSWTPSTATPPRFHCQPD
jgi:hypothetical protein